MIRMPEGPDPNEQERIQQVIQGMPGQPGVPRPRRSTPYGAPATGAVPTALQPQQGATQGVARTPTTAPPSGPTPVTAVGGQQTGGLTPRGPVAPTTSPGTPFHGGGWQPFTPIGVPMPGNEGPQIADEGFGPGGPGELPPGFTLRPGFGGYQMTPLTYDAGDPLGGIRLPPGATQRPGYRPGTNDAIEPPTGGPTPPRGGVTPVGDGIGQYTGPMMNTRYDRAKLTGDARPAWETGAAVEASSPPPGPTAQQYTGPRAWLPDGTPYTGQSVNQYGMNREMFDDINRRWRAGESFTDAAGETWGPEGSGAKHSTWAPDLMLGLAGNSPMRAKIFENWQGVTESKQGDTGTFHPGAGPAGDKQHHTVDERVPPPASQQQGGAGAAGGPQAQSPPQEPPNTSGAYDPDNDPFGLGYDDPVLTEQLKKVPPPPSSPVYKTNPAGPGGDGQTWGDGWYDGTPDARKKWIDSGRPDWQGKKKGEPGYDENTGSGETEDWERRYHEAMNRSATDRMREFGREFGGWGGGGGRDRVGDAFDFDPIDPSKSLRGQRIMPGADPRLTRTAQGVDRLRDELEGFDLGRFNAIGSDDASAGRARDLYGEAARNARGADVRERGPIDPTDTSGAMDAIERARRAYGGAQGDRIGPSDVSGAMSALDRARGHTAGADPNSPEAARARALTASRLEGLSGPDRGEIAKRTFDLLRSSTEDDFNADLRNVGRAASAFGRVGSGVTNTNLADVQTAREKMLTQAQERLSLEAAGLSLGDRLDVLGATSDVGGRFAGQDLDRAGFGLARSGEERALGGQLEGVARRSRDELVGERGYGTDTAFRRGAAEQGVGSQLENMGRATRGERVGERAYGTETDAMRARLGLERSGALAGLGDRESDLGFRQRNEARGERDAGLDHLLKSLNAKRGVAGDLAGLEGQQYSQGRGYRDEIRGERDFENMLARLAQGDRIQKLQLEDDLLNSEFGRWLKEAGLFADVGYGGNPASAFFRASERG